MQIIVLSNVILRYASYNMKYLNIFYILYMCIMVDSFIKQNVLFQNRSMFLKKCFVYYF